MQLIQLIDLSKEHLLGVVEEFEIYKEDIQKWYERRGFKKSLQKDSTHEILIFKEDEVMADGWIYLKKVI